MYLKIKFIRENFNSVEEDIKYKYAIISSIKQCAFQSFCWPYVNRSVSKECLYRRIHRSVCIVVTTSSREGGSAGKHHRGEGQRTRHATGNVSNFLWLLCIPMDRDRRSEMHARLRGVRELTLPITRCDAFEIVGESNSICNIMIMEKTVSFCQNLNVTFAFDGRHLN